MRLHAGSRIGIVQAFNIGDVVACLPLAGLIKRHYPGSRIVFVGRCYAEAVALACVHIDEFLDAQACLHDPQVLARAKLDVLINPFPHREIAQAAYQARVPVRVGNLRRGAYARWCNRFVFYGRRGTGLHEAQLNLRDLRAMGIRDNVDLPGLAALMGLTRLAPLEAQHRALLDPARFNLLLHPRSNGNSREWPLAHYLALIQQLPPRFKVFLTGTEADAQTIEQNFPQLLRAPGVTPLFGRFTLPQFISFIAAADGMVAASTGPLHLAAALGRHALGIYPSRAGLNAKRWGPVGPRAQVAQLAPACPYAGKSCKRVGDGLACACTEAVTPASVLATLAQWQALQRPS
ncbi:MAG TPA: glycosyltransferase family 9 protein [Nevskiaceae bacterium]|nr:glycosyltransferase family 9 protein [Nevskiaceae bacterium]